MFWILCLERLAHLRFGLKGHQRNLSNDISRVVLSNVSMIKYLGRRRVLELTCYDIVIQLIAPSIEVFPHARDISICNILLSKKLSQCQFDSATVSGIDC